jgi:hypothetical protein
VRLLAFAGVQPPDICEPSARAFTFTGFWPLRTAYAVLGLPDAAATESADWTPDDKPPVIQSLPPGPSSVALVLSALASFGVFHAGRSIRKIHLAGLPEWYHHGGPVQIGHVTVFDPRFAAPALCKYESPVQHDPPPGWDRRWEREIDPDRLSEFLRLCTPRGPPRR